MFTLPQMPLLSIVKHSHLQHADARCHLPVRHFTEIIKTFEVDHIISNYTLEGLPLTMTTL